ncbi:hypothetical protein [Lusitaniella coriacea]|uniref:hypothetical protein n=1 Tax=Lusitaniella coriacea TaxID=1983105 RepID=UPI003CF690C9
MKIEDFSASNCRCCNYYKPEGRRGGTCSQLGVPVRGCWKTCCLGVPAFASQPDLLKDEIVYLEHSLSLECGQECSNLRKPNISEVTQK